MLQYCNNDLSPLFLAVRLSSCHLVMDTTLLDTWSAIHLAYQVVKLASGLETTQSKLNWNHRCDKAKQMEQKKRPSEGKMKPLHVFHVFVGS